MKRTIFSCIGTAIVTAMLFVGSGRAPVVIQPVVDAQSANPRGDLVTRTRLTVNKINTGFDEFIAERAEYTGANINFTAGDLSGANVTSPSTYVADDVDQVMTDLNNIITDVKAGGTIASGEWANVLKIR